MEIRDQQRKMKINRDAQEERKRKENKRKDKVERERERESSNTNRKLILFKSKSTPHKKPTETTNSAPPTLFSVSETHLTISLSKSRPSSFQVACSVRPRHTGPQGTSEPCVQRAD